MLRALPLGGYVAFPRAGEAAAAAAVQSAAEDEGRGWRWWRKNPSPPAPPPGAFDASDPALFENRPFPQQAAVVSAGVIANLLLAWSALFGSAVSLGVPPSPPVTVSRVVAGGAAGAHSATSPPPLRLQLSLLPSPLPSPALPSALGSPLPSAQPLTASSSVGPPLCRRGRAAARRQAGRTQPAPDRRERRPARLVARIDPDRSEPQPPAEGHGRAVRRRTRLSPSQAFFLEALSEPSRSGRTLTLAIAPPPATARTIGVVLSTPPEPARSPRVPLPPGQAPAAAPLRRSPRTAP